MRQQKKQGFPRIVFLFPGQGSQYVGMGRDLYEKYEIARDIYKNANEILGWDVAKLSFEGPKSKLMKTCFTQPAILVHSYTSYCLLVENGIMPSLALGHSLGEYSALLAAGVTDFQTAIRLVNERGRFMHEAIPQGSGAMVALLGIERETVEKICEEVDGIVEVANYNAPGQIVISGEGGAVNAAVSLAHDKGARKVIMLPVGAPFHCSLLLEASEQMSRVLEEVEFGKLAFPIYANVTGREIRDSVEAKDLLRRQISSSVMWEDSVLCAGKEKSDAAIEVGPGKVLSGLNKRIFRDQPVFNVEDRKSLEATLEGLERLSRN